METGVLPVMEKANYVGNKRRLAKYIVDKFPDGAKSIADVMCGVGAVLIEAARRGYRVRGNDLSIVPYYYTKGVFEGTALSEEDVERLKDAAPHDGWLTREWKGMYPRSTAIRRYLDGLVKKAKVMPGGKALAAKAVMSAVLQTMYADSGSGYSTLRYEKPSDIQRLIDRSAREVNGLIGEVGGKGTVTNENARIRVTPKMRGYLAAHGFFLKKETTELFIPGRPYIKPAYRDFKQKGVAKKYFRKAVSDTLKGK